MVTKTKRPKEQTVVRTFFIQDSTTDKLYTSSTDKKVILSLQLAAEGGKKRKIGTITKSTKTLIIRRRRADHLFRNGNAYGFNQYILKEAKLFDTISLGDEFDNWKIPVKFILENGKHLNFKQQGFELQLFVSLEDLEQFKVLKKENRRI